MIYSLDNRFLLLRNFKVGSTSLEIELSNILPDSAIVTEITDKEVSDKFPNFKPRNYKNFYNHIPYSMIHDFLPMENIKKYIFVRNPYDVVLSYYFHKIKDTVSISMWKNLSKKEIEKSVEEYFNGEWLRSSKWLYFYNGRSIVDEYLKYENGVEKEINRILPKHGLTQIKINTFERQYRPKEIKYGDIFSKKQQDLIANEWFWEFENLGYNI